MIALMIPIYDLYVLSKFCFLFLCTYVSFLKACKKQFVSL